MTVPDDQQLSTLISEPFTLVVPMFNETARLPACLPRLVEFITAAPSGSELIVVDDGSQDGSVEAAQDLLGRESTNVRLLCRTHEGKGSAIQAGLGEARTATAAFCDLDIATAFASLVEIVAAAADSMALVVGSRDVPTSQITRHQNGLRQLCGRIFNRIVQAVVAPGVVDTQCGAKAARTAVWDAILAHTREQGFAWDVEVVACALRLRIPVREIGVEWRHVPGSRVHLVSDGRDMLLALRRIRRRTVKLAPLVTSAPEIFRDHNAEALASADTSHWWFRSKAHFVAHAAKRWAPTDGWLVDIGCGSAGVTSALGWDPTRTAAVEGNEQLAVLAHQRAVVRVVRANVIDLPLATHSAGLVCVLDVLEHLNEPVHVLQECRRIMKADGVIVVTVPAHPRLWSATDVELGHVRRYTGGDLRQQLEAAGFRVNFVSHIFSWLVLPVWLARRSSRPELGLDKTSSAIDLLALVLTRIERQVIRYVRLPFGTSLLCVATVARRAPRRALATGRHLAPC